jgi:glutamyl-tRNA synthetase
VIEFQDLVKGPQRFEQEHIGDFIIARADGSASFMYCNAIDDALMGVSFALRGDDHLTNTPRQILILKTLRLPIPTYGHFPTILGPDSRPLSKRNGSRSIKDLREEGYLTSAILNYLARLGHHYKHQDKDTTYKDVILSLEQLAENFDLNNVSLSPAHYDPVQLNNWQKLAMMKLTWEACWEHIQPHVLKIAQAEETQIAEWPKDSIKKILENNQKIVEAIQPNLLMPKDAEDIMKSIFIGLTEDKSKDEQISKILTGLDGKTILHELLLIIKKIHDENPSHDLSITTEQWHEWLETLKKKSGKKGKELFLPIRLALTGEFHGPELRQIMNLLGPAAIIRRIVANMDTFPKKG